MFRFGPIPKNTDVVAPRFAVTNRDREKLDAPCGLSRSIDTRGCASHEDALGVPIAIIWTPTPTPARRKNTSPKLV